MNQDNETTNKGNTTTPPSLQHREIHPMQSLAVITVAGFGGAIAGLSMSRRGTPTMHHVQLSSQLPWLWALGCATFAGVIEFSTLVSPTRLLINTLSENDLISKIKINDDVSLGAMKKKKDESKQMNLGKKSFQERILYWDDNSTATLGDYALGGAFAGAIFKGSQIRPTNSTSTNMSVISNYYEYDTSSSTINNGMKNDGSIKQKRAIGRGKVVTLANKKQIYSSKTGKNNRLKVGLQSQSKTAQNMTLKNQNSLKRASFAAGLGPGIILGICAGFAQIFIGRLNLIMEEYYDQTEENYNMEVEENESLKSHSANNSNDDNYTIEKTTYESDIKSNEVIDDITRSVKAMTTDEIRKEIERLKSDGK